MRRDPEGKLAREASAKHAVTTALSHASHKGPQPTAAPGVNGHDTAGSGGSGGATAATATEADREADLLEAGRLTGGGSSGRDGSSRLPSPDAAPAGTPNGTSSGGGGAATANGTARPPASVTTSPAEDASLRSADSGTASPRSPTSPQSPTSPASSFRSRTSSHLRRASVPRILREFQDATNTPEDAPRPPDEKPKPVQQLKSELHMCTLCAMLDRKLALP